MTRPINVFVLGATGSIGQQTLDVIDRNPGRFKLFGLTEGVRSANRQAEFLVLGKAGDPDFDGQVRTASGGPFWAHPDLDLDQVTVEQALNHPRWSMGPKVTVDSATLMNKGLELIEAHHLFGLPLRQISVVVHPQSAVHSLVEFVDGSLKAQLGRPDMRLPISIALGYPDRLADAVPPTNLEDLGPLEFYPLDEARFPAVRLARAVAQAGAGRPAVLNAANEEAVNAFLAGDIPFSGIIRTVERTLEAFSGGGEDLEDILEADRWSRAYVKETRGILR